MWHCAHTPKVTKPNKDMIMQGISETLRSTIALTLKEQDFSDLESDDEIYTAAAEYVYKHETEAFDPANRQDALIHALLNLQ